MGRDDVGVILLLIGMGLFLVSLIALFRPLPRLWMPTRKAAIIGLGISVGSCVTGATILPPPDKTATESSSKQTKKAAQVAEARSNEAEKAEAKRAVLATWKSLLVAVKPCDQASGRMAKIVASMSNGHASIYEAYDAAKLGSEKCRETLTSLNDLDVPEGVTAEAEEALGEALEVCRNAYLLRRMSLKSAQVIFDGDFSPSAMSNFKEQASSAQAGTVACVAGFMSGGLKAGIDLKEFNTDV